MPTLPRTIPLLALLCAASLSACETEPGDSGEGQAPAGAITYNEHVAPIFVRACDTCHTAGGIAPMALDTAKAAKDWAPAIKAAVQGRTMPPWLVTSDGSCGDYKDAEWLSEAEIKTISDWADGGAWAGDPAKAPAKPGAAPTLAAEVKAGTAIELEMPVTYAPVDDDAANNPTGVFDDYRCFPIQTGLDKDVFVTATEIVPGDPEVVHHVLVFSVNPQAFPVDAPELGSNDKVMKHLDAKHNDRDGWPCYAAAGQGVLMDSLLVAWAPGEGVNHYPKSTGLRVPKGNVLVMQVHYNVQKKQAKDRTKVRFALADTVEREAWMALHDPFLFSSFSPTPKTLKPGVTDAVAEWSAKPTDLSFWIQGGQAKDLEIHGVYPHMHKLGRKMVMTHKVAGGEPTCVTEVNRWDFDWQRMYYFKEPIPFGAGHRLNATCTFDTSGKTKPVLPGFGTDAEMCLMGLYVTTPKK